MQPASRSHRRSFGGAWRTSTSRLARASGTHNRHMKVSDLSSLGSFSQKLKRVIHGKLNRNSAAPGGAHQRIGIHKVPHGNDDQSVRPVVQQSQFGEADRNSHVSAAERFEI